MTTPKDVRFQWRSWKDDKEYPKLEDGVSEDVLCMNSKLEFRVCYAIQYLEDEPLVWQIANSDHYFDTDIWAFLDPLKDF